MERKEFLKTCAGLCLGPVMLQTFLSSCSGHKYVSGTVEDTDMVVNENEFAMIKNGVTTYRKYILVQHDKMQFPICVFRRSATEYKSVWMKCPHQGAELQVFGEKLQCPAHGSEFDADGQVLSPPADTNLRIFETKILQNKIRISLKNNTK